jgi:hypothetical protein
MKLLAATIVTVALLVAGCGGDGEPESFEDDPGQISVSLLSAIPAGSDSNAVQLLQRNFLEGCVLAGGDTIPELDVVQQEGLVAVCGCTYPALVEELRSDARSEARAGWSAEDVERDAVARFLDLDETIREGGELPDDVILLVADCIQSSAF